MRPGPLAGFLILAVAVMVALVLFGRREQARPSATRDFSLSVFNVTCMNCLEAKVRVALKKHPGVTVESLEIVKSERKNILESILDQGRTVRILFRTGRPSVDVETVGNDLLKFLDAAGETEKRSPVDPARKTNE